MRKFMRKFILKLLDLEHIVGWIGKQSSIENRLGYLENSADNRLRDFIKIKKTLQNLDNHDVIVKLHNRIKKLEEQS